MRTRVLVGQGVWDQLWSFFFARSTMLLAFWALHPAQCGQVHLDEGAAPRRARGLHGPPVSFHDLADDGQPEARAGHCTR